MLGLEFLISLVFTATAVYFIRKKLAKNKEAKEESKSLRQKDIKKARKKELRENKFI